MLLGTILSCDLRHQASAAPRIRLHTETVAAIITSFPPNPSAAFLLWWSAMKLCAEDLGDTSSHGSCNRQGYVQL